MITKTDPLYSVKEALQENNTDFDIMREKPMIFKAGGKHIVCAPVRYFEHHQLLKDLSSLLLKYNEIFYNVEFLNAQNYKTKDAVSKAIASITIFNTSRSYKSFITKAVPEFIRKWTYTIKRDKFVKMPRFGFKKYLEPYTTDELITIFFYIYVFNYEIVKKKTFECLQRIIHPEFQHNTMHSDSSTKSQAPQMPAYSPKAMRKSDLDSLGQARTRH